MNQQESLDKDRQEIEESLHTAKSDWKTSGTRSAALTS